MQNPLLLDMVLFFKSAGLVKGDGIDAFRDILPNSPDNCVSLVEYAGSPSTMGVELVNRSVQVSVRDSSANAARAKALLLFKSLQSDNAFVRFTPDRWGQVYLRQTPFRLKVDTQNRIVYAFNVGVTTTIE